MKKLTTLLLSGMLIASFASAQVNEKVLKPVKEKVSQTTPAGGTIKMTKADFLKKVANYETNPGQWKYLGDKPAIIDFYATWCGPCRSIASSLEQLAKEYEGKIYIYKVDTDRQRELAAALGIQSLPSLLFIPMDGQPQMLTGARPKDAYKKIIDDFLLTK